MSRRDGVGEACIRLAGGPAAGCSLRSVAALVVCAAFCGPTLASDVGGSTDAPTREIVVQWAPDAEFYPQYTADPVRPQSALKLLYIVDSDIPQTSSSRFSLHLGGRFGLVRWHREGRPDRGWQLDFEEDTSIGAGWYFDF